jgi:hypothetical protein
MFTPTTATGAQTGERCCDICIPVRPL